jgi:zinc protease
MAPAVTVAGLLHAGALNEPADKAGLAAFTATSLMSGTQRRSTTEIYAHLEANGAILHINGGLYTTRFVLKALQEDLEPMLGLAAEILQTPAFPARPLENARRHTLASLERRGQNPRHVAHVQLRELLYPAGHACGRSLTGYPDTIARVTADDVRAFYQAHYGPSGAVISIVGDVDLDETLCTCERLFGAWRGNTASWIRVPPAPRPRKTQQRRAILPGANQAEVIIGYFGPARRDEDYIAAQICDTLLGRIGMYGRLGRELRDRRGLGYHTYSRLEGGLGPGPWTCQVGGVAPSEIASAIDGIRVVIRRLCDEPVSSQELRDAQTMLHSSSLMRTVRGDDVAITLLELELYDLGLDYLQRYPELVNAVSVEDVQAVACKYLDPDVYALVVAGPAPPQGGHL